MPSSQKQTSRVSKTGNVSYVSRISGKSPSGRSVNKEQLKSKPPVQPPGSIPITIDGMDVTPRPLNPFIYEGSRERQISNVFDHLAKRSSSFFVPSLTQIESQNRFHANLLQQKQETESNLQRRSFYLTTSYADDMLISEMVTTASSSTTRSEFSRDQTVDDEEPEESLLFRPIPSQISLVLNETDTIFLLDIASSTVSKTSEEAEAVDEDNKLYDFLTKGKGRNRKILNVAVQTLPILMKARDTITDKVRHKNISTYVSTWEMYDTFNKTTQSDEEDENDEEGKVAEEENLITLDTHKLNDEISVESYRTTSEEKQITKLIKSKPFYDAVIVIERILGNNCYNEQQKTFKGLSEPDFLRDDVVYKYRLRLLWIYANEETEGKCVTNMALNEFNEDIVAVAYGKFFYNDKTTTGIVMVWNFKNPRQPERSYTFNHPVTSIAFSKTNPNLLAVGLYNGNIKLLDISKRETVVIRENRSTSYEPVWSILWFTQGEEEDIMASFGDGRVCKFQITGAQELKCTQIMVTAAAEGKLKGIKYLKRCDNKEIAINRYEEARTLALHPKDPFTYFVGTSEGVVHRCSTNYYNEHMDLFKAHDGGINTFRFSPFVDLFYYTCGDDFRARLWAEGIHEPLVTSEASVLPILDLDWSSKHSTVSASLRSEYIMIWDLQRKMHAPQSRTKSPSGAMNTVCRFTKNGRCLMVGDLEGHVHVYSLEDMPCPPFFPENLIMNSLKKLLVTKPEIMRKLRKLGKRGR